MNGHGYHPDEDWLEPDQDMLLEARRRSRLSRCSTRFAPWQLLFCFRQVLGVRDGHIVGRGESPAHKGDIGIRLTSPESRLSITSHCPHLSWQHTSECEKPTYQATQSTPAGHETAA